MPPHSSKTRPSGAEANGKATLERILSTAAELFADKGFAGTTTREVAEQAGIKRSTLYHHIDSKEELLLRLCNEAFDRVEQTVDVALSDTTMDPLVRLRAALVAHVTSILASRDLQTVMLLELRSLDPEQSQSLIDRRTSYEQRFHALINEAQQSGALRDDIPPSLLVLAVFNLCNWTLIWFKEDGPYSASELGESYAGLFIEGAQAR